MSDAMDTVGHASHQSLDPQKPLSSLHINLKAADSPSSATHKLFPSRHSPVAPLAPLEYLQNQRRGSITDPSLHAASSNSPSNSNHNTSRQPNHTSRASPAQYESNSKQNLSDMRARSSYVFGDASSHPIDKGHHQQVRKPLRSPSTERDNSRSSSSLLHHESQGRDEGASCATPGPPEAVGFQGELQQINENLIDFIALTAEPSKFDEMAPMNVDTSSRHDQRMSDPSVDPERPIAAREMHDQFDYNIQNSGAVEQDLHPQPSSSQLSPLLHGTKRKMSSDRAMFGDEIDPQLVGPGVPSGTNSVELDGPAPKRRGSAVDTQRIAQLSLYERRNSVDSRGGAAVQWWPNDRRDSTPSIFSNGSGVAGYPSGFSADSPHGRQPPGIAAFAWPAPNQPDQDTMHNDTDTNMNGPPRQFDHVPSIGMMPPITFAPDRRVSVVGDAPPTSSAGPTRVLRSRSRPPSRQLRSTDISNPMNSGPSSGSQDDPVSAPSPTGSGKMSKDSGTTPYSRSPELRVSHKLAERKRRKEMKDLFDELRDQLPADRGMKASKWEILSKAIDFVAQLKQSHQDMAREIEILRHELDGVRQGGIPPFPPGGPPHAVVYGQGPVVPGPYPPGAVPQHPPHPPFSRPPSSQTVFPPGGGPSAPPAPQNGTGNRAEAPPG